MLYRFFIVLTSVIILIMCIMFIVITIIDNNKWSGLPWPHGDYTEPTIIDRNQV